jgi:hypothetical protein
MKKIQRIDSRVSYRATDQRPSTSSWSTRSPSSRGWCYDWLFLPILGEKNWRFSLKPMLWSKFCTFKLCFESKTPIFCWIFRRKYKKNYSIGPRFYFVSDIFLVSLFHYRKESQNENPVQGTGGFFIGLFAQTKQDLVTQCRATHR